MPAVELRDRARTPLGDSLPRLRSFVSPYVGIVQAHVELLHAPDEPRLPSVSCVLARADEVLGAGVPPYAGGSHWDAEAALAAAIGEGLERYSAAHVPEPSLVTAAADELGDLAPDPRTFALFHADQYADPGFDFAPFLPSTRLRWVQGFSLPDCEPRYLPAQLVYLRPPVAGEPAIGFPTTNGVACAPTLEEAVLAGLFEAIERDCFMLVWYNRLSLPRLDWSDHSQLAELDRRYFAPTGLDYEAVDLSAFFDVPVALGVVRSRDGSPPLGIGAGAASTVEEAWRKALSEAFSVYRWARDNAFERPDLVPERENDIGTFDDHILYYTRRPNLRHVAFLDASPHVRDVRQVAPVEGDGVASQIASVAARLASREVESYAVDITAPEVRQGGFHVVRVLCPALCPLDVRHDARYLGGTRLYEAAWRARLSPAPLRYRDLNPHPHPFP
jgi:ribosomal protein S12 methylthiotransferase accessory factor